MATLGEKIRDIRLSKGLTVQQCADLAGFKSRQDWGNIEAMQNRENFHSDTMKRIIRAIGVEPAFFFEGDSPPGGDKKQQGKRKAV